MAEEHPTINTEENIAATDAAVSARLRRAERKRTLHLVERRIGTFAMKVGGVLLVASGVAYETGVLEPKAAGIAAGIAVLFGAGGDLARNDAEHCLIDANNQIAAVTPNE